MIVASAAQRSNATSPVRATSRARPRLVARRHSTGGFSMYDHPWKIRHALSAAVELLKAAQDVRLRAATALEDDTDTDWQSEHDRLYERMGTANEQISYVLDFALKARKSEEAVEAVGEIESTAFRVVQVFAEKTCCGLRAAGSIVYARKPSLLWLPGDTHVKPLCAYAEDLICNYTVEPDALDPAEDAEIRDLIARLEIEAGSIARQFPKRVPTCGRRET